MRRAWIPALLLLAAGLVAGGLMLGRAAGRTADPRLEPTRLFAQVLSHVRRFGVDSLSERELYRRAADGLVGQLNDEYAAIAPAAARDQLLVRPGAGGLGLLLTTRGERALVLGVIDGSPADEAGIRAGDQLLEIAGLAVEAGSRAEVLSRLVGPPGSAVQVRTRRPGAGGAVLTHELTRARPLVSDVAPPVLLEPATGYVAVGLVGRGAAEELQRGVADLERQGMRRLVLDLRGASQGDLEEAVRVASLFLDRGAPIVEVRGRGPEPRRYTDRDPQAFASLPLVVLVDGGTADAAEVVAAALQDNDRAVVVGEPSFGRGLSPEVFDLGDRMVVRISTGRWYAPSGRPIQRDSTPDSLAVRPTATTRQGRTILGGGGVVPDSVLRPDTLTDASRDLLRGLHAQLPAYHRILRQTAANLAGGGGVTPGFEPTPAQRDRLFEALVEGGVVVERDLFTAAVRRVNRELGDEVVRAALGRAGLIRHRARRDPAVQLALTLLRRASTPEALVFGPGEGQAAPGRRP